MKTKEKQPFFSNRENKYIEEDDQSEWIQMSMLQNQKPQPSDYLKLQDQGKHKQTAFSNNPYNYKEQSYNLNKVFTEQPIVPQASYNSEPNKIVMNGITYIHKDAIKGIKKRDQRSKKPQMQVACQDCSEVQLIPANACAFICYSCELTQDCHPKYGIFICGHCETKVWYLMGTSHLIKCTKCGTINNIPIEKQIKSRQILHNPNPYFQQQISEYQSLDQKL